MGGGGGGGRKRARKAEGAAGFVVNRFQHNYVQADDCDDYGGGKRSEGKRTVGAGLPRGVNIIWKSKQVNGKPVRDPKYGIAKKGYQASCKRPKCKKHNTRGAGKAWTLNFATIEDAAEAFEQHCRNPFDLDNEDIMHWS